MIVSAVGTVTLTGASSSGGVFWAQFSVTFPTPFAEPPLVTVNCELSGTIQTTQILSVSTTGFTCRAIRINAAPVGNDHRWTAVGVPA